MKAVTPVSAADAYMAGVSAERERITELAGKCKTVLVQPGNGYPVDAVPFAALLDVLAAGALGTQEVPGNG